MPKLDNEVFRSIFNDELKQIVEIFKKYNYELRIAGGAVRDLIMNIKPKDVDLATNATPDEMKFIFEKENLRMLNRNGEKHGTITVRPNDKENYEITTLRIDVQTDGRHAEVKFTNDWRLDANRRDLTVNSLFLDFDGNIYDFFNGVDDIKKKEIHFVGKPETRITEDYLRILRYFRFYGRICDDENKHDELALKAIKENASGLKNIHGERIWVEFKSIVIGKFADSLMKKIIDLDVHKYIGLPEKPNINEFSKVYGRIKNLTKYEISPITMICALLVNSEDLETFSKRVRFSNDEKKLADFILKYRNCDHDEIAKQDHLKPYKNLLVDFIKDNKIYEKLTQLLLYQGHFDYIDVLLDWNVPVFPINGETIAKLGVPKGPIFSKILNELKESWKNDFNFNCDEQILLSRVNDYLKKN